MNPADNLHLRTKVHGLIRCLWSFVSYRLLFCAYGGTIIVTPARNIPVSWQGPLRVPRLIVYQTALCHA